MVKLIYKLVLTISLIMLMSCAAYKKHFGGHSADYMQAETTPAIKYPKSVKALRASDRYMIPEIPAAPRIVEFRPPDYYN